jgi:hypothetical protein
MSGRLVGHLGMALCGVSMAVGCSSSGPPNTNGNESTSRGTAGGRSNGSATAGSGGSQASGSSGGLTGGRETGGGSGGRVGCQSACNLPGQYCDDAGECVACLADQECKSTVQPYCYVDAGANYGTCVQCLGSSECPLGQVCSPELLCVPGCGTTNSCGGETPICEGDSGACVTCLSAHECTSGLVCRDGACTVCKSDFECYQNYMNPPLWVCSPEENCVQCRIDADCPDGQHCVGTGCH